MMNASFDYARRESKSQLNENKKDNTKFVFTIPKANNFNKLSDKIPNTNLFKNDNTYKLNKFFFFEEPEESSYNLFKHFYYQKPGLNIFLLILYMRLLCSRITNLTDFLKKDKIFHPENYFHLFSGLFTVIFINFEEVMLNHLCNLTVYLLFILNHFIYIISIYSNIPKEKAIYVSIPAEFMFSAVLIIFLNLNQLAIILTLFSVTLGVFISIFMKSGFVFVVFVVFAGVFVFILYFLLIRTIREIWALYDSFKRSYFIFNQNLLESDPNPIFIISETGNIFYQNLASKNFYKYIVGAGGSDNNNFSNIIIDKLRQLFIEKVQDVITGKTITSFYFPFAKKSEPGNLEINTVHNMYNGNYLKFMWFKVLVCKTEWKLQNSLFVNLLPCEDILVNEAFCQYTKRFSDKIEQVIFNTDLVCGAILEKEKIIGKSQKYTLQRTLKNMRNNINAEGENIDYNKSVKAGTINSSLFTVNKGTTNANESFHKSDSNAKIDSEKKDDFLIENNKPMNNLSKFLSQNEEKETEKESKRTDSIKILKSMKAGKFPKSFLKMSTQKNINRSALNKRILKIDHSSDYFPEPANNFSKSMKTADNKNDLLKVSALSSKADVAEAQLENTILFFFKNQIEFLYDYSLTMDIYFCLIYRQMNFKYNNNTLKTKAAECERIDLKNLTNYYFEYFYPLFREYNYKIIFKIDEREEKNDKNERKEQYIILEEYYLRVILFNIILFLVVSVSDKKGGEESSEKSLLISINLEKRNKKLLKKTFTHPLNSEESENAQNTRAENDANVENRSHFLEFLFNVKGGNPNIDLNNIYKVINEQSNNKYSLKAESIKINYLDIGIMAANYLITRYFKQTLNMTTSKSSNEETEHILSFKLTCDVEPKNKGKELKKTNNNLECNDDSGDDSDKVVQPTNFYNYNINYNEKVLNLFYNLRKSPIINSYCFTHKSHKSSTNVDKSLKNIDKNSESPIIIDRKNYVSLHKSLKDVNDKLKNIDY